MLDQLYLVVVTSVGDTDISSQVLIIFKLELLIICAWQGRNLAEAEEAVTHLPPPPPQPFFFSSAEKCFPRVLFEFTLKSVGTIQV